MTRLSVSGLMLLLSLLFAIPADADEVRVLARPEEAYSQFVTLISQAKKSIDVATFIFEPCDPSAQIIMDSLAARAHAGVKVRVLLDAISQGMKERRNIADAFARYGIPLRLYSAALTPTLNLRMHTKMMIVDGRTYIAGGRNLSDAYFSLSPDYNFIDEDLFVSGPAAAQAAASFEELWNAPMTSGVRADARSFKPWSSFCKKDPTNAVADLRAYFRRESPKLLAALPSHQCANVSFHSDSPHFSRAQYGAAFNEKAAEKFMTPQRLKQKRASAAVLNFLDGARARLEGQNWVYIPIGQLADGFARLRARGVPVQIMTNADIESGPQIFREVMEYAIDRHARRDTQGSQKVTPVSSRGSLRDEFALSPRDATYYIHAKTLVRDRKDVIVGSFNLDSRSYNTNLEAVTVVRDCPSLAAAVRANVETVQRMHRYDVDHDLIPAKREPSPLAKLLAVLNVGLL